MIFDWLVMPTFVLSFAQLGLSVAFSESVGSE